MPEDSNRPERFFTGQVTDSPHDTVFLRFEPPIVHSIVASFPISVILPLMGLPFAFGIDKRCFWSRDRGSQIIPMPTVSLARGSPVLFFYAVPSGSGFIRFDVILEKARWESCIPETVHFWLPFFSTARTSRLTMHKPVSCLLVLEYLRISFWREIHGMANLHLRCYQCGVIISNVKDICDSRKQIFPDKDD